jgi:hypothetical protein
MASWKSNATVEPGWGRVLVRMFLVILPSTLVGFLVATLLLPASFLVAHPGAGWLLNVPPGLLAGLVLGLVLRPTRERLGAYLGVAAVMTVVIVLLLLGLAQLRLPGPASDVRVSSIVIGVLVAAVVQSVVAGGLWWQKSRDSR